MLQGNMASNGAALFLTGDSAPMLVNNVIEANSGTNSSVVFCAADSAPSLVNNSIVNNYTGSRGAVLATDNASVSLLNNIIAFNSGGIEDASTADQTVLYNCLYDNTMSNYLGMADATGSNGNISKDPLLASQVFGDMRDPAANVTTLGGSPMGYTVQIGCKLGHRTVRLDGFNVINTSGQAGRFCGSVVCSYSGSVVANCTLSHTADRGLKCNYTSSAIVEDSLIEDCAGSGISCERRVALTVRRCIIRNCSEGGIECWNLEGDPEMRLHVESSIIADNTKAIEGAGVYAANSAITVEGCTIVNNNADSGAGGGYFDDCAVRIHNSILWGNTVDSVPNQPSGEGVFNPVVSYCDVEDGWTGEGNISADPLLAGQTYHLALDSPCSEAGDPTGGSELDVDGDRRPAVNWMDIGADEIADTDDDENCTLVNLEIGSYDYPASFYALHVVNGPVHIVHKHPYCNLNSANYPLVKGAVYDVWVECLYREEGATYFLYMAGVPTPTEDEEWIGGSGYVCHNPADEDEENRMLGWLPPGEEVSPSARQHATLYVIDLDFIRQDNSVISGDDACHMVSKYTTRANLADSATFHGPPVADTGTGYEAGIPDPDTFRVQAKPLPMELSPEIRLEVIREDSTEYSHQFGMVNGFPTHPSHYRTDEHIRLVSNVVDDNHLAHQTPLVKVRDTVRATLLLNDLEPCATELRVTLPATESGVNALRRAMCRFIPVDHSNVVGNTDADETVAAMERTWAQAAVTFGLSHSPPVVPVQNIIRVVGVADGQRDIWLEIDQTVVGDFPVGTPGRREAVQIAEDIADAINNVLGAGFAYSYNLAPKHALALVVVNQGNDATIVVYGKPPSTSIQIPIVNLGDGVAHRFDTEALLGNYGDGEPDTIDIFVVNRISSGGREPDGLAMCPFSHGDNADCRNSMFLNINAADSTPLPFTASHEAAHFIMDTDHVNGEFNLLYWKELYTTDFIWATKRLTPGQQQASRVKNDGKVLKASTPP